MRDFEDIKALWKPTKVVVGCGGLAIAAYYTAGTGATAATAAMGGGLTCSWGFALESVW